jgi:hypothetical protein
VGSVTDVTVEDDLAGDGLALVPNTILFAGFVDGVLLSVNTAVSNSPGGSPSSKLELSWTLGPAPLTTGGGTVTITASATDYAFPVSGVSSVLTSNVGGTLTGTGSVKAQQWVDLGNGLFAMGSDTPGQQGGVTGFLGPAFSDTAAYHFASDGSYSITDQVILVLGPQSSTGGNLTSTVVPEPVTMFLGGTGVLMLGYAARRRLFGR